MDIRRVNLHAEFKPRINNVTKSCANSTATAAPPGQEKKEGEGEGGGGGGGGLMSFLSGGSPEVPGYKKTHKEERKPSFEYEEATTMSFPNFDKTVRIGATDPKKPNLNPCAEAMKGPDIISLGRGILTPRLGSPVLCKPCMMQKSMEKSKMGTPYMGKANDIHQREIRSVLIVKPQIKVINEAMSSSQKGAPVPTGGGLAKVPTKPVYQTYSTTTPPPLPPADPVVPGPIDKAPPYYPIPDTVPEDTSFPVDEFNRDMAEFEQMELEQMEINQKDIPNDTGNITPRMSGVMGISGYYAPQTGILDSQTRASISTIAKKMQSASGEKVKMNLNPFTPLGISMSKSRKVLPGKSGNTIFEFNRGYLF